MCVNISGRDGPGQGKGERGRVGGARGRKTETVRNGCKEQRETHAEVAGVRGGNDAEEEDSARRKRQGPRKARGASEEDLPSNRDRHYRRRGQEKAGSARRPPPPGGVKEARKGPRGSHEVATA